MRVTFRVRFLPSVRQLGCLAVAMVAGMLTCASGAENGISARTIAEQVEQYLVEMVSASFDGEPVITVTPPSSIEELAACQAIDVYLPPGRKLRSDTMVGVRCQDRNGPATYVRAKVVVTGTYYVASQTIGANQTISDTMLEARIGDLLLQPAQALLPPNQLIGRITTQRIPAGSPLRITATRSRNSVQRGSRVRVEVRGPGMVVTSLGEAINAADVGGTVQVRTANGKTIHGVVSESGTVFVNF